jgi:hypothetical protein
MWGIYKGAMPPCYFRCASDIQRMVIGRALAAG